MGRGSRDSSQVNCKRKREAIDRKRSTYPNKAVTNITDHYARDVKILTNGGVHAVTLSDRIGYYKEKNGIATH